jgi:hypothetical protein
VTVLSHKIQLDPNNKQASRFARAAGTARFAYNWALAEWQKQYEAHQANKSLPRPSEAALRRQLNAVKKAQFPWMSEVTKCAPQLAIMNLGEAFRNFFAKRGKYPQFKRKGVHDSFQISNDQFQAARAHREHPKRCNAQADLATDLAAWASWDRGPQCARHDAEQEARPLHRGYELLRVPQTAAVQGCAARRLRGHRGAVLPEQQAVFDPWLWLYRTGHAAACAHMDMRGLRRYARS